MITIAATLIALACAVIAHRITGMHDHIIEHLDRIRYHLEQEIDMSQQETVNALVERLTHVKTEILTRLAELQAQIDAGVPTEQLDLGPLTSITQSLDDIVPDAPADPVA